MLTLRSPTLHLLIGTDKLTQAAVAALLPLETEAMKGTTKTICQRAVDFEIDVTARSGLAFHFLADDRDRRGTAGKLALTLAQGFIAGVEIGNDEFEHIPKSSRPLRIAWALDVQTLPIGDRGPTIFAEFAESRPAPGRIWNQFHSWILCWRKVFPYSDPGVYMAATLKSKETPMKTIS